MKDDFTFSITNTRFDEDYHPSDSTRATTNFANLARGDRRRDNLRNALRMIDNRFNAMAHWDNPTHDRYAVKLDIVTAELSLESSSRAVSFPLIEILQPTILDRHSGKRIVGIPGNNFSSYVRDYDFSVLLPQYNAGRSEFSAPEGFGKLHGNLFRSFINSAAYKRRFDASVVICLSVSTSRTYHRTENHHPVLGVEYHQHDPSSTDNYFALMGLKVRYFMPPNSIAPLAFYFSGDLLNDHSDLQLIATISTMETFQRIYRPEIYNANSPAGKCYRPHLNQQDFSLTQIVYDREERSRLAAEQGKFAEENFIKPYRDILEQWSAQYGA